MGRVERGIYIVGTCIVEIEPPKLWIKTGYLQNTTIRINIISFIEWGHPKNCHCRHCERLRFQTLALGYPRIGAAVMFITRCTNYYNMFSRIFSCLLKGEDDTFVNSKGKPCVRFQILPITPSRVTGRPVGQYLRGMPQKPHAANPR